MLPPVPEKVFLAPNQKFPNPCPCFEGAPKERDPRIVPGSPQKDSTIKEASHRKGGAGAVLNPMWRKREFLGRGGLKLQHEVLLSTKSKALRQKGKCFVADIEGCYQKDPWPGRKA